MTDRYIVTTSVTEADTGRVIAPVSLDQPGVTRDLEDARRLRNEYILTIGAAGTIGAPARIYTSPDADQQGWVVEYLSTRGKLVTRETVTFVPAMDHPPYVRHIGTGGKALTPDDVLRDTFNVCPRCGNSGTTDDFMDAHTCRPRPAPGTQHVDLLDDPWNQKG